MWTSAGLFVPVCVFVPGACNQDDWISAVRPVIEKRIQKWAYFFILYYFTVTFFGQILHSLWFSCQHIILFFQKLQNCIVSVFRYSEGEIRFNLMAIVSDRKMIYERKIAELQTQLTEVSGSKRAQFREDMTNNNVFFCDLPVRLYVEYIRCQLWEGRDHNYIVVCHICLTHIMHQMQVLWFWWNPVWWCSLPLSCSI